MLGFRSAGGTTHDDELLPCTPPANAPSTPATGAAFWRRRRPASVPSTAMPMPPLVCSCTSLALAVPARPACTCRGEKAGDAAVAAKFAFSAALRRANVLAFFQAACASGGHAVRAVALCWATAVAVLPSRCAPSLHLYRAALLRLFLLLDCALPRGSGEGRERKVRLGVRTWTLPCCCLPASAPPAQRALQALCLALPAGGVPVGGLFPHLSPGERAGACFEQGVGASYFSAAFRSGTGCKRRRLAGGDAHLLPSAFSAALAVLHADAWRLACLITSAGRAGDYRSFCVAALRTPARLYNAMRACLSATIA